MSSTALTGTIASVVVTDVQPDQQPEDNDVVAGWIAAVVFVLLIAGMALICRSLVTRLRNVERAAEQGLYDPSDPKPERERRGLGATRPPVR